MNENHLPLSYNKETSMILKGIAIMMMVVLHLFNRDSLIGLYVPLLKIGDRPFIQCFAEACSPVGIFLFLSGYGLYYSFKQDPKLVCRGRIVKLYIRLWITYIIFIPLCAICLDDGKYPGSILEALQNLVAYRSSWNYTTWFILPFAFIMLSCAFYFRRMSSAKSVWCIFLISLVAYYSVIARIYGWFYAYMLEFRPLLIVCRYIEQLCPFLFGALICYFSELRVSFNLNSYITQRILLILIVMCFTYSTFKGIPFYPIYSGVLVLLFANLRYGKLTKKILVFLGHHLVTIWLIHTYFCDVLLKSFIYSFKYPLFIFLVEMAISTLAAVIIDKIFTPVTKKNLLKYFKQ